VLRKIAYTGSRAWQGLVCKKRFLRWEGRALIAVWLTTSLAG